VRGTRLEKHWCVRITKDNLRDTESQYPDTSM
jgi:hypothetical protein